MKYTSEALHCQYAVVAEAVFDKRTEKMSSPDYHGTGVGTLGRLAYSA